MQLKLIASFWLHILMHSVLTLKFGKTFETGGPGSATQGLHVTSILRHGNCAVEEAPPQQSRRWEEDILNNEQRLLDRPPEFRRRRFSINRDGSIHQGGKRQDPVQPDAGLHLLDAYVPLPVIATYRMSSLSPLERLHSRKRRNYKYPYRSLGRGCTTLRPCAAPCLLSMSIEIGPRVTCLRRIHAH